MKTIRKGDRGAQVKRWQYFLIDLKYGYIYADGDFGKLTKKATVDFQKKNGLVADGIVGKNTYLKAFHLGYNVEEARNWPPKPDFRPLSSYRQRVNLFGEFKYRPANDGTDNIIVNKKWARKNITGVVIPQLKGVKGASRSRKIWFHKKAADQLRDMFQAWDDAGLANRILSYHGSYVPRYVRGRRGRTLSNHSWGSAFDVNYKWNRLGHEPALVGRKGSVRELVQIANEHGFYWGGHFSRRDGMHFEVAKIF